MSGGPDGADGDRSGRRRAGGDVVERAVHGHERLELHDAGHPLRFGAGPGHHVEGPAGGGEAVGRGEQRPHPTIVEVAQPGQVNHTQRRLRGGSSPDRSSRSDPWSVGEGRLDLGHGLAVHVPRQTDHSEVRRAGTSRHGHEGDDTVGRSSLRRVESLGPGTAPRSTIGTTWAFRRHENSTAVLWHSDRDRDECHRPSAAHGRRRREAMSRAPMISRNGFV